MNERLPFRVVGAFDTETCNICTDGINRAFPVLYIFNAWDDVSAYIPDETDTVGFLRTQGEALAYIEDVITQGQAGGYVPVICAYNLMFDLQTIVYDLNARYKLRALAQSSTHVYTLDVEDGEGNPVLRFWDTYFLEMNGLAAMGRICGFAKAVGDWDYSLLRTPETPLTPEELGYAKRDVQVIPAYLRYLLESNAFIRPDDLGSRVLTKTGIVRTMAARDIGPMTYSNRAGKRIKLSFAYTKTCTQERALSYTSYALRKCCFRGGFTFTGAAWASRPTGNVASVDAVSMHHLFINGRLVPVKFTAKPKRILKICMDSVLSVSADEALSRYWKPFEYGLHICVEIEGLRLRSGSVFERCGIALLAESKFKMPGSSDIESDHGREAENAVRRRFHDRARNAVFAFGKLYRAERCTVYVTETELWTMAQVYEWDSIAPVWGEATMSFSRPPDYVTLQSHMLYKQKDAVKAVLKIYDGSPMDIEAIPDGCPDGLRGALEGGTMPPELVSNYYNSTVKGMYNGIYGTQAQDVYKPDYDVSRGEISVDRSTSISPETWEERQPKKHKVHYNYGMRIVGGSRMHLAIACMLIDRAFGNRVDVLGGDTDSMKLRCDDDISDADICTALSPLAEAAKSAIDTVSKRVRECFPEHAAELKGVGSFEVERCGPTTRYAEHMEAWNKARLSVDEAGKVHVTCAGLRRPVGSYHIETFIEELLEQGNSFTEIAPQCIGYNVTVANDVCHALQRTQPKPWDRVRTQVTDYLGNTCQVDAPEAIALYDTARELGETTKSSNYKNIIYMSHEYGRKVDTTPKRLTVEDGKALILTEDVGF